MCWLNKKIAGTGWACLPYRFLLVLWVFVTFGGVAISDAYLWIAQDGDSALFRRELELAEKAPDRDTRIEHFRSALAQRPNHPGNIAIEYHMAAEMSQRWDPEHPQPLRRAEALRLCDEMLAKYKHMDYYDSQLMDSASTMQMMVPQAAIWAACLERGVNQDDAIARKHTLFAMECLQSTWEKRKQDWSSEPLPSRSGDPRFRTGGPFAEEKQKRRREQWQQRQDAAAEGDVFGPIEMACVKAAVRQFGYTYGGQRPEEVAIAMNEIIRRFPGTPMAKVAQGHIDRATAMLNQSLLRDFEVVKDSADANGALQDHASHPVPVSSQFSEASHNGIAWAYWIGFCALLLFGMWGVHRAMRSKRTQNDRK